jgi:exoribonuclease R
MRVDVEAAAAMSAGLDRIRKEAAIPDAFPADVLAACDAAVKRAPGAEHRDRTDRHFVTLDPATSVDLDQAFDIEQSGSDLLLHYAIADVGWFVRPGDALDTEAFDRGVTVYLPDQRASLYPPQLSEGAASLLPNVDRPAVVFVVRVADDGISQLDGVERAIVRSRAKLAYDTVSDAELPTQFAELHRRIEAAEQRRDAMRFEFPEQQIARDADGQYTLRFRPRADSEEHNAALSLATNLAVADALLAAHTGVFRVMADVNGNRLGRLRHFAQAFGLEWPRDVALDEFVRTLPHDDYRTSAFLLAVRRASGGAGYEAYRQGERPWHSAVAATYAHATAPLRRLQDRHVIETALAVANGRPVPDEIRAAFDTLPRAMARGEQRANRAERQALDLAEAVVLSGQQGRTFPAIVIDEGEWGVEFQIADPAIVGRVPAHRVDPGDEIRVKVVHVDVVAAQVTYERVA